MLKHLNFKDAKWCDDVDCSTCTIPYRNICIKIGFNFHLDEEHELVNLESAISEPN